VVCTLPVDVALDLTRSLRLLRLGGSDPTWWFGPDEAVSAWFTPEGAGTLRLAARPGRVEVAAWGPGAGFLAARARALCGLDDDLEAFTPVGPVAEVARRFPGVRLPRVPVVYGVLMGMLTQQRVTWQDATRAWRLLCRDYGVPAPGPAGLRTPPDPARLARATTADLHPFGLEGGRARRVLELATRAAWLQQLLEVSLDEARRRLLALPGIGPWTAAMLCGGALGDADAVVLGDYHMPNTIAWWLAGEERADDARMLALLRPHRPHRWRVVQLTVLAGIHAPRRGPRLRPGLSGS
jgi:3-methyladenine DNA glycosylase/8-oxoguanine DNA glycosylase